jgi:hypothetical protein
MARHASALARVASPKRRNLLLYLLEPAKLPGRSHSNVGTFMTLKDVLLSPAHNAGRLRRRSSMGSVESTPTHMETPWIASTSSHDPALGDASFSRKLTKSNPSTTGESRSSEDEAAVDVVALLDGIKWITVLVTADMALRTERTASLLTGQTFMHDPPACFIPQQRAMGLFFGYPPCCIEAYIQLLQQPVDASCLSEQPHGALFLCGDHLAQVRSGHVTRAALVGSVVKRWCPLPYTDEDTDCAAEEDFSCNAQYLRHYGVASYAGLRDKCAVILMLSTCQSIAQHLQKPCTCDLSDL